MIDRNHVFSVKRQAELVGISRGSVYYLPTPVSAADLKHFGDDAMRFEVITPERVRRFFATQAKNYKTPSSLGVVVSSLRGYFRWRATLGERSHALVGALAYPANWQLASLPKSLAPAEVEQLEAALGQSGPSMLRADAHRAMRTRSGPAQRRGGTPEPGRHRLGRRHDHIAPDQGPP
jgi:hypothetical protein